MHKILARQEAIGAIFIEYKIEYQSNTVIATQNSIKKW